MSKRKTEKEEGSNKIKKQKDENDETTDLTFLEKLPDDIFYEVCLFVDINTLNNLSLVNLKLNKMHSKFIQSLYDYDEFEKVMRMKRVEPRLTVFFTENPSALIKKYKRINKLEIEIFFKALDRYPGGNCDEMVLRWLLTFDSTKKTLKKGSIRNWDGEVSGNKMVKLPNIRDNWKELLKSIASLSFEEPNKKNLYYFTIEDKRSDWEEYDTEWSKIEVKVKSNGVEIFNFLQQVIYTNERGNRQQTNKKKNEKFPITPIASKMLEELQTFCGITRVEKESDGETISAKESREFQGKALKFNDLRDDYPKLETLISKLD
ncbi:hypothetical protein ABK040_009598 [Willaertia magna]